MAPSKSARSKIDTLAQIPSGAARAAQRAFDVGSLTDPRVAVASCRGSEPSSPHATAGAFGRTRAEFAAAVRTGTPDRSTCRVACTRGGSCGG
jgi:hypothetical protein